MLWIEVELAWGLVHRKEIHLQKVTQTSVHVREVLSSVIDLLERYSIPATWSFVGHLLLDRCTRGTINKPAHADMPRPNYSWTKGDWYRYDPCTDIEKDPAWYGKDIVDRIVKYVKKTKTPHEIGCHSFSHQQFGDPGCDEELARAEITKCVELMKKNYGIIPKVFAFPRDYVGNLNTLRESGFIAYRNTIPKLYPCLELERTVSNFVKKWFSLFIQLLSYYLCFPPHVVTLSETLPGLWSVPGCLAYSKKRLIPLKLVTAKAIQGVNRAIQEGKIFSMYTHLRNFGENGHFLSDFEKILAYVSIKRKEGLLEVKTMRGLLKDYQAKQATIPYLS